MDASYITPFVVSIQNVFTTMLQLPVEVGEPRIKTGSKASHDVSGIIGMSGDVTGSIVLSFPLETAEAIVSLFCGESLGSDSDDFADAIGELVNMVSGGAKAGFDGKQVSISCPSVVVGTDHYISQQKDVPCVVIPCTTDCGELSIEVAIREQSRAATSESGSEVASH
ncbi:MAG: chemotaxis protein CheX [Planctomycetota bacterium]|nr:MAG: chemotaxis protein CheX [Planctomycetota bacterium]